MARNEKSSDPLPFVQVDRAAKQIAAMLAGPLGVTFQHALGGLVQFWGLCGERRDIEKLIAEGKDEVVLAGDEVKRRFRLAMGKDAELPDLVDLHILEDRTGGQYRVRGMSRFFEPLAKAKRLAEAAAAGGKASAKARKEKHGTAQPRSGAGSAGRSESVRSAASESVRTVVRTTLEPDAEPEPEAAPNTDGRRQTSEDRLQNFPPPPAHVEKPVENPVVVGGAHLAGRSKELWEGINNQRSAHQLPVELTPPARWAAFNHEVAHRAVKAVLRGHQKYLADPHFADRNWPLAFFLEPGVYVSRITHLVDQPPPPPCAGCGDPSTSEAWNQRWCGDCVGTVHEHLAEKYPTGQPEFPEVCAAVESWLVDQRAAA